MRKFLELNGDASAETISSLEAISPDFVNYLVEFPFGDVYSLKGCDGEWCGNGEFFAYN